MKERKNNQTVLENGQYEQYRQWLSEYAKLNYVVDTFVLDALFDHKDILLTEETADDYIRLSRHFYDSTKKEEVRAEALKKGGDLNILLQSEYFSLEGLLLYEEFVTASNADAYLTQVLMHPTSFGREGMLKAQLTEAALEKGASFSLVLELLVHPGVDTLSSYKKYVDEQTANKFLKAVIESVVITKDDADIHLELIKFAVDKGAGASKIIELSSHSNGLQKLSMYKEFVTEENATQFLESVMGVNVYDYRTDGSHLNPGKVALQYELVQLSLDKGADPNTGIYWYQPPVTPLELAKSAELIQLLRSHGARCKEDVEHMSLNNLDAPKAEENKIPYLMHQIWLTHPSSPREMFDNDIELILENKELLAQDNHDWNYIIWVNDKSIIPNSVNTLEEHGIEVREIADYQEAISSYEQILSMIEEKAWGLASDILRYEFIKHFGGVYADVNFKFDRSVEDELYKYDYFSISQGNAFFAAKPEHPIMLRVLDVVKNKLENHVPHPLDSGNFPGALATSWAAFFVGLVQGANRDGNIDMTYPYPTMFIDDSSVICDYPEGRSWFVHDNHNTCLTSFDEMLNTFPFIGEDGANGNQATWNDIDG